MAASQVSTERTLAVVMPASTAVPDVLLAHVGAGRGTTTVPSAATRSTARTRPCTEVSMNSLMCRLPSA